MVSNGIGVKIHRAKTSISVPKMQIQLLNQVIQSVLLNISKKSVLLRFQ